MWLNIILKQYKIVLKITAGVALTSDFIAGFCGETEEAHLQTVALLRNVKYHRVYCFPYSMRQVGMLMIPGGQNENEKAHVKLALIT